MRKLLPKIFVIVGCFVASSDAIAARVAPRNSRASAQQIENPTSEYTYNYMYPYLNNQMKTDLNPGITTSQSTSPINVITKTYDIQNKPQRRVIARSGGNTAARSATPMMTMPQMAPQNILQSTNIGNTARGVSPRKVVARATTSNRTSNAPENSPTIYTQPAEVSTARCYADYTECMNGFCERPNTEYNRCYCSAKLSQIDSEYQPKINDLIMQIAKMKGTNQWTDAEMSDYWNETIGRYTGDDVFAELDNALNINWADLESRVRGQNAFATGHEYCVQHLTNCAYAASNLRDAYRSEIARDCATYKTSLDKIKTAAESIIEANK
ncbi:MAG: hypothetical protein KBS86_03735 [Proteobacteria bacterium]|nr:hypothetical protein [Candidatus Enterousia scatequi]